MRHRINAVVTAGFTALSVFAMAPAAAQTPYPDKPVTLVVPFAAGGPTDVVARMLAIPMGKSLGQSVLVENTVGAGGTIAATKVARAAPNGYTLFIHHMGMSTAPALYKKLSFDPMKDYEYIGQVVDVPMTLLARKDFPPANYKELEAYVRANKDKVSLANAGLGAVSHLCGLLFMSQIGVELNTIPYKGAPAPHKAVVDLAAKGRMLPLLVDGGDHVDVAVEKQGRRLAPAGQPGKQVGPVGRFRITLGGNSGVAKQAVDVVDAGQLVAGRVGGVELDQALEQLGRAGVDAG